MGSEHKHAGSRRGSKKAPTFRPQVLLLAAAVTAAIVAWGYLVYLAIDFGTSARAGESRAWWFLGLSSLGAVLPESQVRPVLGLVDPRTLQVGEELEEVGDGLAVLLVPDLGGRSRGPLLRSLAGRSAVAGPSRPWREVRASFTRALRALPLRTGAEPLDTEQHLATLVLRADADALADLRAQVLEPLAHLRPATAEKLTTTLREWLLHHGRRDDVAEALFVHPQTVRYRLGQLRELYGDRLEDPDTVLGLTLALGMPPTAS